MKVDASPCKLVAKPSTSLKLSLSCMDLHICLSKGLKALISSLSEPTQKEAEMAASL